VAPDDQNEADDLVAGFERNAPRHEIAVGGALAVPRALWGIERGVGLKENDAKRRAHGFGPRRGCRCRAERADRGLVDRNGAGDAGQSDEPTQAGAMPVEIRREWLVSLRFRIGGVGIMRCRS
jgi:hypothetical protein